MMTDASKAPAATILLIEDDSLVANVTAEMLEEYGYRVQRADTIDTALEILTSRDIRLVLCDIGLPGSVDGLSLARHLREWKPAIPILLMTGHQAKAAQAGGEFLVLQKPFGFDSLVRLVAFMLEKGAESVDQHLSSTQEQSR